MSANGRFISPPIHVDLGPQGLNFERADIQIHGLDQSGSSFEGRIFLNNPNANSDTAPNLENGYAGSFHVYGYGVWPPDLQSQTAGYQEGIRAPMDKDVIATEAIRAAAAKSPDVVVTIVPIYHGRPAGEAFQVAGVDIVVR